MISQERLRSSRARCVALGLAVKCFSGNRNVHVLAHLHEHEFARTHGKTIPSAWFPLTSPHNRRKEPRPNSAEVLLSQLRAGRVSGAEAMQMYAKRPTAVAKKIIQKRQFRGVENAGE